MCAMNVISQKSYPTLPITAIQSTTFSYTGSFLNALTNLLAVFCAQNQPSRGQKQQALIWHFHIS